MSISPSIPKDSLAWYIGCWQSFSSAPYGSLWEIFCHSHYFYGIIFHCLLSRVYVCLIFLEVWSLCVFMDFLRIILLGSDQSSVPAGLCVLPYFLLNSFYCMHIFSSFPKHRWHIISLTMASLVSDICSILFSVHLFLLSGIWVIFVCYLHVHWFLFSLLLHTTVAFIPWVFISVICMCQL